MGDDTSMLNNDNQPRRPEGWVARPTMQAAIREMRERDQYIALHGMLAYAQECVRSGHPLPYPFSDSRRWSDIAEDAATYDDWRAAARWLLTTLDDYEAPDELASDD
jgi:hypothetical protein